MAKKKFYTPVIFQYNLGWLKSIRELTDELYSKQLYPDWWTNEF